MIQNKNDPCDSAAIFMYFKHGANCALQKYCKFFGHMCFSLLLFRVPAIFWTRLRFLTYDLPTGLGLAGKSHQTAFLGIYLMWKHGSRFINPKKIIIITLFFKRQNRKNYIFSGAIDLVIVFQQDRLNTWFFSWHFLPSEKWECDLLSIYKDLLCLYYF